MTRVDLLVVLLIAAAALAGMRKGLIGSAFSAVGVFAGAVLGARLAPHLLFGGDASPYTPVVGLLGAATGAIVLEMAGTLAGGMLRRRVRMKPLRTVDAAGGLALGALAGLVLVWVAGAVALHLPHQPDLRQAFQRSALLRELNEVVPPARLLAAIERVDPFPMIVGPAPPEREPDPLLLRAAGVGEASPSVVRVLGSACGLSVSGSGWVAGPERVVTAAHVVAGQRRTSIEADGAPERLRAFVHAFDARNDLAVLHVPGLRVRALRLAEPRPDESVAILGFPDSGPFTATAGRLGRTATVVTQDAYGGGPVRRTVTSLRGLVRQGNSGGPAVNGAGEVVTTIFAARMQGGGGYGVPPHVVREALAGASGPVSTGHCVAR